MSSISMEQCQVEFETPKKYSTGSYSLPVFVSLIDINDDNRSDIIVANQNANKIGIFFNVQGNYFSEQVTHSSGYPGHESGPQYISVADVNDDDKPDIIVANKGDNSVGVLFNYGSGLFDTEAYETGTETYPSGVAVVDVNNDKKPDIIVTNQHGNTIGVFLNSGHGKFPSQHLYRVPHSFGVTYPQVVDVNGDTHPDIIVANPGGACVGIFFNFGNGTFVSWTTFSTGFDSQPNSVFVADVNDDNKPDLIVGNFKASNVGVLLNAGNGKFLNQTIYSTGLNSQPRSVFVVDINCDNKPDIIVANSNEENIGIFLNFGNGIFQPQRTYATGVLTKPCKGKFDFGPNQLASNIWYKPKGQLINGHYENSYSNFSLWSNLLLYLQNNNGSISIQASEIGYMKNEALMNFRKNNISVIVVYYLHLLNVMMVLY
ncbi:unnamed protein product [Adineta steineri]|uniref:Uncharacterized protein n=1 Tax=Adineta steineri TaxID=433720 RepID=A0A815ECA6_9BILA|nr:unnamed protein product [Adineta steineri]CAF1578658.1 unnamed protein product [Adineta steineri]